MQRVTVTFDLIFDLRRRPSTLLSPWRTTFSFTAGGVTHRGLSVPGWPTLQVGQTITALLRKDDDWQTLAGWVNHDTGEVAKPTSGRTLRRASWLAFGVGALVLLLHAVLMLQAGPVARAVQLLVVLLWAGYGVLVAALAVGIWLRARRRRREEHTLEDCLRSINERQRRAGTRPVVVPSHAPVAPAQRRAAKN